MKTLETLILDKNRISCLPKENLSDLPKLKRLSLKQNPITQIHDIVPGLSACGKTLKYLSFQEANSLQTSAMCPVVFQKDYYESVNRLCPNLLALDGHGLRHKSSLKYPNFADFDRNIEEKLQSLRMADEAWISPEEAEASIQETFKNSLIFSEVDDFQNKVNELKAKLSSAITPASCSYVDTLATLRFAHAAKDIKTQKVGPAGQLTGRQKDKLIKELKAEVESLHTQLNSAVSGDAPEGEILELKSQIEAAKTMAEEYKKKFEDIAKLSEAQDAHREQALDALGMNSGISGYDALKGNADCPIFVNLSDDDYLKASLVYLLNQAIVTVGNDQAHDKIFLTGLGLSPSMATINVKGDSLSLVPGEGTDDAENRVLRNGERVTGEVKLKHNDRLMFGHACALLLIIPSEAKKAKTVEAFDLKLSLEAARDEVKDSGSKQFSTLLPYIEACEQLRGKQSTDILREKLHKACPLVDEANAITQHLRPQDGLKFHLAVMDKIAVESDISSDNQVPELVVRLTQLATSSPQKTSKKGKQGKAQMSVSQYNHHHVLGIPEEVGHWMHINKQAENATGGDVDLFVWNWDKFLVRLEAMRDIYDRFNRGASQMTPEEVTRKAQEFLHLKPMEDAWREFGIDHVSVLCSHKETLEARMLLVAAEARKLKDENHALKEELKACSAEDLEARVSVVEKELLLLDEISQSLKNIQK